MNLISEKYQLFRISTDSYAFGTCLIYAPLSTLAVIAKVEEADRLEKILLGEEIQDESMAELLENLTDRTSADEALQNRIHTEADFVNLTLLPTNRCNFNCSYCYSAKGRAFEDLSPEKAQKMIDYFIHAERTPHRELYLSILGGGEPLLVEELLKKVIPYAADRAWQQGFKLHIKLITNGSLITDEVIEMLRLYRIETVVSYEILEKIQNLQRKHFVEVTANIKRLEQAEIALSFNSVITKANVNRMEEMVDKVARDFPTVKWLSFEPEIVTDTEQKEEELRVFHTCFIQSFLQAAGKAEEQGIDLSCTVSRNVDCISDRYCAGELALTALGHLSICPCLSSPQQSGYQDFCYGKVNDSGVQIDQEKLVSLLNDNLYSHIECRECWARWNCGGGCMHAWRYQKNSKVASKCDFTRELTLALLWQRMEATYQEEYGFSILEYIQQQDEKFTN